MDKRDLEQSTVGDRKADRRRYRSVLLARLIFAFSFLLLLVAVGILVSVTRENGSQFSSADAVQTAISNAGLILANGIVSLLIISRYADHLVGWLLLFLSLFNAITLFCEAYTVFQQASGLFAALTAWVAQWSWFPTAIIPIVFIPLTFPDGRLLSRRWRFAAAAASVGLCAGMVSAAINPGASEALDTVARNPLQIAGAAAVADFLFQFVATPLLTISLVGAVGSLLLRFRGADVAQRVQLKWVFYTLALGMGLSSLFSSLSALLGANANDLSNLAIQLTSVALPVSIGIVILRYRLYDIDIIIRRTLVYSVVTLALAVVYFGSVVFLQRLFTGLSGEQSPVAIVLSTLIIAALFSPLRRRVQGFIDRRFYRRRYDAVRTLEAFAAVARDEVDLETLRSTLLGVVEEAMQPTQLSLWIAPSTAATSRGYARRTGQAREEV